MSSALLLGARIGRSLGLFRASFLLRNWMFAQQSIVFPSAMAGFAEKVCWGGREEDTEKGMLSVCEGVGLLKVSICQ